LEEIIKMIALFKGNKKVAEIDVAGWTVRQIVELMRAVLLNGRTGKYYRL
jgi:hypothetical protein